MRKPCCAAAKAALDTGVLQFDHTTNDGAADRNRSLVEFCDIILTMDARRPADVKDDRKTAPGARAGCGICTDSFESAPANVIPGLDQRRLPSRGGT